ncbi:MAG: hypothetical protein Q9217_001789 [Psora testacea]
MARCEHVAWLRLSEEKENTIYDEARLGRVLADLISPEIQQPSLLLFVGGKTKDVALRVLFSDNNIPRARGEGLTNLRVDNSTVRSNHPIFFADTNLHYLPEAEIPPLACHVSKAHPLRRADDSESSLFDLIHARLFGLFSDVICVFAEDFHSLDDVVFCLKRWAAAGWEASNKSSPLRPRVIIVLERSSASVTYNTLEMLELEDLRFNLRQQDLIQFFSAIVLFRLPDDRMSCLARHRALKELVLRHADEMRQLRRALRQLFSAAHLSYFFQHAITKLDWDQAPNLMELGCERPLHNLWEHAERFLQITGGGADWEKAMMLLASGLLMNAYPPRMHGIALSPGCGHS